MFSNVHQTSVVASRTSQLGKFKITFGTATTACMMTVPRKTAEVTFWWNLRDAN